MSHPYYEMTIKEQEEVLGRLSGNPGDKVSAVQQARAALQEKNHPHADAIGRKNMSAYDFTKATRHLYEGREHIMLKHLNEVTKQNYTSLDHV